jgi:hypothetical protein
MKGLVTPGVDCCEIASTEMASIYNDILLKNFFQVCKII